MNTDAKDDKASLEKREMEIQSLMRQMKSDNLHKSPVYQKLEQELSELKTKLMVLDTGM